ncbi:MAG: hypothetical protein J7J98_06450 [candidate division Zixibacteria bacterium]|nr:hypothetical protein [candidate division Zixibacteria bacterium]
MYCPKCECDYAGWTGKCPIDGTLLAELNPIPDKPAHPPVPYETITDLIRENNGSCEIELRTTEVGRERKMSFPYRGHGFAWAKKMIGQINGIAVDLHIDGIGKNTDWGFPYQGYGFAWEKQMRGWVSGHKINLSATRVAHEKKFLFPYRGHGYSWAEELTGDCGKLIRADMKTTEIGRDKTWFFFYFGFGYAWIKQATLTLSLAD